MKRQHVLVGAGTGFLILTAAFFIWGRGEPPPAYRFAKVEEGALVAAVNATGTVQAVVTVQVGSQTSGQIAELLVDFNSQVKSGEIIAKIDSEQIEARLRQMEADHEASKANLAIQRATVERMKSDIENAKAAHSAARHQTTRADVQFKDAERDYARKQDLVKRGAATVAETDRAQAAYDAARVQVSANKAQEDQASAAVSSAQAAYRVAEAQVKSAEALVLQRQAAVEQVRVEFDRATIRSPIDGVVVLRNVDLGQTVAASLQAPTLFTIAQDLKEMQVHASIDEADIGKVAVGQSATFTVSAHPTLTFRGTVEQIRLAPQTIQNVVTYVVVVAADNRDLKLLPGMTATLRIVSDQRDRVAKVPNAALRFRPAGAAAASSGPAPAGGGGVGSGSGGGGRGPQSPEQIMASLNEALALTAEQQKQIRDILDDSRRQFMAIPQDLPQEQRRARFQSLRNQAAERISGTLDPERRAKYAEIRRAQSGGATATATTGRVFVIGGDGKPKSIDLRLGIGDGQFTELLSGDLKAGQDVIIGGGERAAQGSSGGPRLGF
jgi:HlyD family secretion protein